MNRSVPTPRSSPSDFADVGVTPERRRSAKELLKRVSALNNASDGPATDLARGDLGKQAAEIGMKIISITITHEAMPDPLFVALPRSERNLIEAVGRAMGVDPAGQIGVLEALVAKHPRIAMLRNHLGGAYHASDQRDRALAAMKRAVHDFPTYIFAFCNLVQMLLSDDMIEEARAIMEESPRGPLFHPSVFDPHRDTFHVSEAVSFAFAVGQYMVATKRPEAAAVQLELLMKIAPGSPQTRMLKEPLSPEPPRRAVGGVRFKEKAKAPPRPKRPRRPHGGR